MKTSNPSKRRSKAISGRQALRGGGYAILVSVIVWALLIVVNVLVSALPATTTKYDISATQLYSITSNTKVVVNALDKDVTIYWVVQSGQEDSVIENLLAKYESLSDYLTVEKVNPDVYPTFTAKYTDEEVNNNSLVGVSQVEGVVVEGDRESYAFQMPYILIPAMTSGTITDSLIDAGYTPIMPIAQGLNTDSAGEEVTAFLTTSDYSFSKIAGYDLDTYEKEEGDIDGPFALGVSIADASGGQIIWFSSSYFLDDMYNSYSSGANGDLAMNALSSLIDESESMAIRSKSLNYNYLTINEATSSLLKVVMIGVCPLIYLGIGVYVIMSRRRRQNEAV
jgi:hypothetical protein